MELAKFWWFPSLAQQPLAWLTVCLCDVAAVDWSPEDEVRVHVVALDGSKVRGRRQEAKHLHSPQQAWDSGI